MKTYVLVWVRPGLYCGDWVVTSVGRQAEVFDVTDRGMLRVNGPLSYVDLVPGGLASVVRFPKARRVFWCVR